MTTRNAFPGYDELVDIDTEPEAALGLFLNGDLGEDETDLDEDDKD